MAKLRAMLAWEHGPGRGHVLRLRRIARVLADRFDFDAAVCTPDLADALRDTCVSVFQGAALRYDPSARVRPGGYVPTATWGEFMGDLGFRDVDFLATRLRWWRETLLARRSVLLIADYAPLALLAARSLGMPAVASSQGYGLAPHGTTTFPVFIPEHSVRLHDEGAMLEVVNRAASQIGLAPLAHLPDVYAADAHVVPTFQRLDPYGGRRVTPLVSPIAHADLSAQAAEGDEVFVYFSTSELDDPETVRALTGLGLPTRIFAPNLSDATRAALTAAGVTVENVALSPQIIAARSRMLLHAGQHGSLCLGLVAGLPMVALPQQLEQAYHAGRAEEGGTCRILARGQRSAEQVIAAAREVYADADRSARARAVASDLRAEIAGLPVEDRIRAILAPLID